MTCARIPALSWRRHPVVAAATVLALAWATAHGWYLSVTIVAGVLTAIAIRRALRAAAGSRAALRARAEYEHSLSLTGDPRGLYGRFPPVQAGWFPDPGHARRWRYFDGALWTGHVAPR